MPPKRPHRPAARSAEIRRASFAQINASWAIECQVMDAVDLAMQERVIRGELTHEQAIETVKDRYRIGRTVAAGS